MKVIGKPAAVLRVRKEFGLSLVLIGATEAWKVADQIAEAGSSVTVLLHSRIVPSNFDVWRYALIRKESACPITQTW